MTGKAGIYSRIKELALLTREYAQGPLKLELTPEQEAEVQRLADAVALKTKDDAYGSAKGECHMLNDLRL